MKNLYTHAAFRCSKLFFFLLLFFSISVNAQELMRANLYVSDVNGLTLVDGNLTNYNNIYSNNVDMNDGWKLANPGINFGIYRSAINLAVERRSIYLNSDTTFFRMWNMLQANYSIKLMLKNLNHPGMMGFVRDNYLNTETAIGLNDTTYYNFTVNSNPASASEMRFQLIYAPNIISAPLDVNFTGISARRQGPDAMVEWNVASEILIRSYTVEHSFDGRTFTSLKEVTPYDNSSTIRSYTYNDLSVSKGDIFYRIKATSDGGRVQYSSITKVSSVNAAADINVYPNRVINKTVQVQFIAQVAGRYSITLSDNNGRQQQLPSFLLSEGQSTYSLNLPQTLACGVYYLRFSGPGNSTVVKSIIIL